MLYLALEGTPKNSTIAKFFGMQNGYLNNRLSHIYEILSTPSTKRENPLETQNKEACAEYINQLLLYP